jgi:hypothetical protein
MAQQMMNRGSQRCPTQHRRVGGTPLVPATARISRPGQAQPRIISRISALGLAELAGHWVGNVASLAPAQLAPAVTTIGGDLASVVALAPTIPGLARLLVSVNRRAPQDEGMSWRAMTHRPAAHYTLQGLYYVLGTRPNPLGGFLDYYLVSASMRNVTSSTAEWHTRTDL